MKFCRAWAPGHRLPLTSCSHPQLFLKLGNGAGNRFWAASVPPSEALQPSSSPAARRRHLEAKYLEGKYRRYHPLFGNQEELDEVRSLGLWVPLKAPHFPYTVPFETPSFLPVLTFLNVTAHLFHQL